MSSILVVLLAAFSRLVPHWPNVTAVGAMALFSGARFRGLRAYALPVLAMAISDFFLDFGTGARILTPIRVGVYGSFLVAVALGRLLKDRPDWKRYVGVTIASSVIFFVVTNFAGWLGGHPTIYPRTPMGLLETYTAALPFFRNEVLGDLAWVGVLFGLDALARRPAASPAEAEAAAR
jgi:hypothetical protein